MSPTYYGLCILLFYHYYAAFGNFFDPEDKVHDSIEKCVLCITRTSFRSGSLIAIAKAPQIQHTSIKTITDDSAVTNYLMSEMNWNFLTIITNTQIDGNSVNFDCHAFEIYIEINMRFNFLCSSIQMVALAITFCSSTRNRNVMLCCERFDSVWCGMHMLNLLLLLILCKAIALNWWRIFSQVSGNIMLSILWWP